MTRLPHLRLQLPIRRMGDGGLPQVVVPSYRTSLQYLGDFPLGP